MNFNTLYRDFKVKLKRTRPLISKKPGKYLFIAFVVVVFLVFLGPLFPANVGTALTSCVFAPYVVLLCRYYYKDIAIVPAVLISAFMLIASLIYLIAGRPNVATYYLVAIICLIVCAVSKILEFFDKITDKMKLYLTAGAICFGIVIIASILALLVSIAWWIFCLIAFIFLLGFFITVSVGTAAYTATDDRRQERKRRIERERERKEKLYSNNRNIKRPVQRAHYDEEIIDAEIND